MCSSEHYSRILSNKNAPILDNKNTRTAHFISCANRSLPPNLLLSDFSSPHPFVHFLLSIKPSHLPSYIPFPFPAMWHNSSLTQHNILLRCLPSSLCVTLVSSVSSNMKPGAPRHNLLTTNDMLHQHHFYTTAFTFLSLVAPNNYSRHCSSTLLYTNVVAEYSFVSSCLLTPLFWFPISRKPLPYILVSPSLLLKENVSTQVLVHLYCPPRSWFVLNKIWPSYSHDSSSETRIES